VDINRAEDWHPEGSRKGYRIMQWRDIYPGDDYLESYVAQVIVKRCEYRNDLQNGYIDVDGVWHLAERPLWVRKNS
jgi:hypothetical protein